MLTNSDMSVYYLPFDLSRRILGSSKERIHLQIPIRQRSAVRYCHLAQQLLAALVEAGYVRCLLMRKGMLPSHKPSLWYDMLGDYICERASSDATVFGC